MTVYFYHIKCCFMLLYNEVQVLINIWFMMCKLRLAGCFVMCRYVQTCSVYDCVPNCMVTGSNFRKSIYSTIQVNLIQFYKLVIGFIIIKPTRRTNFSNLFWNETLHVSDSSSVHHQGFFTVHTAMVYVIQVCWQLASRIRMELRSILILLASCQ